MTKIDFSLNVVTAFSTKWKITSATYVALNKIPDKQQVTSQLS